MIIIFVFLLQTSSRTDWTTARLPYLILIKIFSQRCYWLSKIHSKFGAKVRIEEDFHQFTAVGHISSPGNSTSNFKYFFCKAEFNFLIRVFMPVCIKKKSKFQILWKSRFHILVAFPFHLKKLRSVLRFWAQSFSSLMADLQQDSRYKKNFFIHISCAIMEHFLEEINPNEKSNKYKSSILS